jgi:mRNA-degrading endonuclease HigB of HigAB toxin-antitoxin module
LINTYETLNKEPSTVIVENKISVPDDMSQQEKYKLNKLKESILQNQIDTLEREAPFKNTVSDKKNQLKETKKISGKILQQITSAIETINTLSSITFTTSNSLYDGITVENYNSTFYNDNLLIIMIGGNNVGVINKLKTGDLTKLTNKINVDETSVFSEENKKVILEVLNQYKIEMVENKHVDTKKKENIKEETSVLTDLNINNINLKGLQNIANALAVKDKTLESEINPIKYNETELRKYIKKYLAKNHSNKKDVTEYFNANIFK